LVGTDTASQLQPISGTIALVQTLVSAIIRRWSRLSGCPRWHPKHHRKFPSRTGHEEGSPARACVIIRDGTSRDLP